MSEDDLPEWCGQCSRGTRQFGTPDGPQRCPVCHPEAGRPLAQHRRCPHCLQLTAAWDRNPCGFHIAAPERQTETTQEQHMTTAPDGALEAAAAAANKPPKVHAHPDDLAEEWLAEEFEADDSPMGVSYDRETVINAFRAGWDQARKLTAAAYEREQQPKAGRDELRAELAEVSGYHAELLDGILRNAGDEFDADEAADVIAVRYVRHLERQTEQLAVTRERLENLAAGMELSATTSHPSKKSEIERGCAQAVRGIAVLATADEIPAEFEGGATITGAGTDHIAAELLEHKGGLGQ